MKEITITADGTCLVKQADPSRDEKYIYVVGDCGYDDTRVCADKCMFWKLRDNELLCRGVSLGIVVESHSPLHAVVMGGDVPVEDLSTFQGSYDTLTEDLRKEIERCRELLKEYEEIGTPGNFGKMMITAAVDKAETAWAEHNIAAIQTYLSELRGCK